MNRRKLARYVAITIAAACGMAAPSWAAPGDKPVAPLPANKAADDKSRLRKTSIPAKGLFVGDKLSESTKAKLTELILDSIGMRIELALLVPTGNWRIDGAGKGDNDLKCRPPPGAAPVPDRPRRGPKKDLCRKSCRPQGQDTAS